jgi:hypothetical protein
MVFLRCFEAFNGVFEVFLRLFGAFFVPTDRLTKKND